MKNALIMMTRIPIPGKTKTRLMDTLTGDQCAKLHKSFLMDLFNMCKNIKDEIDIYVTYTHDGDVEIIKSMTPNYIHMFSQEGQDLGDRMKNSMRKLFQKGYEKVILIGTDIPEIQSSYIKNAFCLLNNYDMCFGPTIDGGYYLIGMNKIYDCVFSKDIKWGNKSVLHGTIDIANRNGINVGIANKCNDIDTKQDIIKFIGKAELNKGLWLDFPINTVNFIEEYWSDKGVEISNRG